jgi:hypothetical protein
LKAWGDDAPEKLGRACQRFRHVFTRCDEGAWNALATWFDDLHPMDAAVIIKALAR